MIKVMATSVVGVMEMGNIVPRVGIKPIVGISTLSWNNQDSVSTLSWLFQDRVLTITPPSLPYVTTMPMPTCLYGSFCERSVQTITLV